MARFLVRPHRPWWYVLESIVAVVLLVAAGYVAYITGRQEAIVDYAAVAAERDRLRGLASHLQTKNSELRQRVAVLERVRGIENEAYTEIEQSLTRQQDEALTLRQELAFYRGIVASSNPERQLTIRSLEVRRDGGEGRTYRFEIILTRLSKSDRIIGGRVSLILSGDVNGQQAQRTLAQLSDGRRADIEFQFMQFHKIGGRITLPPDFVPRRVLVKVVTAEDDRTERVERAFDWPLPIG